MALRCNDTAFGHPAAGDPPGRYLLDGMMAESARARLCASVRVHSTRGMMSPLCEGSGDGMEWEAHRRKGRGPVTRGGSASVETARRRAVGGLAGTRQRAMKRCRSKPAAFAHGRSKPIIDGWMTCTGVGAARLCQAVFPAARGRGRRRGQRLPLPLAALCPSRPVTHSVWARARGDAKAPYERLANCEASTKPAAAAG